jgi:membrane associated rhomboid family serine protease
MFIIPYGTREKTVRKRFPYINVLLVAANIIAFAYETYVYSIKGTAGFEQFISAHAFVPVSLSHSLFQLSIVTALFLHAGLLHVVGNMLYLLPFGDNVEDSLGHARYLIFYFLCGIIANLVFAAFYPHSKVPILGASGAIAGVLGGYLALNPIGSTVKGFLFVIILLIRIQLPAYIFIGYWFVMQVFSSVASFGTSAENGGVAFLAHVGGFIAGFILAPVLALREGGQNVAYKTFNNV